MKQKSDEIIKNKRERDSSWCEKKEKVKVKWKGTKQSGEKVREYEGKRQRQFLKLKKI